MDIHSCLSQDVAMTSTYNPGWETIEVQPAAAVLDLPVPEERAEQVEFFKEHGFLLLPGFLSQETIGRLDAELCDVAARHDEIEPVREGFNVEDPSRWPDPQTPVFRKVGGLFDLTPSWRSAAIDIATRSPLTSFLGERIVLYRDVVMMKQARIGREKPWHQDGVYWPYRPYDQVSAFCPLDPCTEANGALQVIPGSHTAALEHEGLELQVVLSEEQQAATRLVPMQPGDVLLFHSLLLHGSQANESGQHRRVAINSFMRDGLTYIGSAPERHCPQVLPV
jgi:hypothetical protein